MKKDQKECKWDDLNRTIQYPSICLVKKLWAIGHSLLDYIGQCLVMLFWEHAISYS